MSCTELKPNKFELWTRRPCRFTNSSRTDSKVCISEESASFYISIEIAYTPVINSKSPSIYLFIFIFNYSWINLHYFLYYYMLHILLVINKLYYLFITVNLPSICAESAPKFWHLWFVNMHRNFWHKRRFKLNILMLRLNLNILMSLWFSLLGTNSP